MEVLHQFATSLTSPTVPVVHAVQYDVPRLVRARIYSGATIWPVPAGVTAGVSYTLPDRTKGYYERLTDGTSACTIQGNEVEAVVAPTLTSLAGTVQVSIVLRQGDNQISTFPFQLRVTARPGAATKPEAQPDAVSVFAGKLFFGAESGLAVPLGIGDGLAVEGGVLRALADPNAVGRDYVDGKIEELWEEIRYVPIAISNFRHTAGIMALGAVLDAVELSWDTNKAPTAQTINGNAVPADSRAATIPGPFTESAAFTLTATDERDAQARATTTVHFYAGIYYGALAAGATVDNAAILGLTRTLQGSRGISFTLDFGGKRPTYAAPVRYGTPKFVIGGFEYSWTKIGSGILFTNASGHTEAYDVWQHGQNVSGNITINVS